MQVISKNIINISWPEPFSYVIPPKDEENISYCVMIIEEFSGLAPEEQCNVSSREVLINLEYELPYRVVVSVVNALGKGKQAIADVQVPSK